MCTPESSHAQNQIDSDNWFADLLRKYWKEVLSILVSFLSILWLFLAKYYAKNDIEKIEEAFGPFLLYVEALNVLILVAAIILLHTKYRLSIIQPPLGNKAPGKKWELLFDLEKSRLEQQATENSLDEKSECCKCCNDKGSEKVSCTQSGNNENSTNEKVTSLIISEDEVLQSIQKRIKRVNNLVKQLRDFLKGFAMVLFFMYALLFFTDSAKPSLTTEELTDSSRSVREFVVDTNELKNPLSRVYSIPKLAKDGKDSNAIYRFMYDNQTVFILKQRNAILEDSKYRSLDDIYNSKKVLPFARFATRYVIIDLVENAFNVLSAVFLILAFQVLYTQTLEENDDSTSKVNYWIPFVFAGAVIIFNFLGVIAGLGLPLSSVSRLSKILCGIFNSIAMLLLFGRFISMEYFYQRNSNAPAQQFYFLATAFVLPFYAAVQPLYGLFDLADKDVGNALLFKSIVLLVCLIGKLFFFMFVYQLFSRNFIHKYLYWLLLDSSSMYVVSRALDGVSLNEQKRRNSS